MTKNLKEITNHLKKSPSRSHWKRIKIRHHHGIALGLFSLYSYKSCGIGEYLDLIPLIDWCKRTHLDIIQLLPLNEIHRDRSPYSAISACALHPIYLSLSELEGVEECLSLTNALISLQKLTQLKHISYKRVENGKNKWLQEYFDVMKDRICSRTSFRKFIRENKSWLYPYSLFLVLQKEQKGKNWEKWPKHLRDLSKRDYRSLCIEKADKMLFYMFLQYLCFSQMEKVKRYATKNKVFILGDLPLLVNPHSFDVWRYRNYFDRSLVAGAPPDDFNRGGQKWELPIYHWDEMRKDGFQWWKERLQIAERFYHLYRIDHVIGLFRIFAIPPSQSPIQGTFVPKKRSLWIHQGDEILRMFLDATSMLPIAEDLGFIPEETYCVLYDLGICGTRIMRWMMDLSLESYPTLTLTSVSTHDLEPLRLWWKENKEKAKYLCKKRGWKYSPKISTKQLQQILYDSHHTGSLFHINFLHEYFSLFKDLRWHRPEDERINVPGRLLKTNWTYRFRASIEEILRHRNLRRKMAQILREQKNT